MGTFYTASFCIQEPTKHCTYCRIGCALQALKDYSFVFEFLSKESAFDYKGLDERYGYEWRLFAGQRAT
jgi:hypothetical protein